MATVSNGTGAKTLADWAKMQDPDGKVAVVANLLSQTNEILEDAQFKEGNLPTGHRVTVATGLPSVFWRSYNKGVPSSKATTAQIDEAIGMLEVYSVVDKDLAILNGDVGAFRAEEDKLYLEAMNQTQAQAIFYGNPANDPNQFMGLGTRYSAISGAGNAQNIISAGGTGTNNSSIWLVVWGENTVFCTFPKGSKAGLVSNDLGEVTHIDSAGPNGTTTQFQAYKYHYQWKNGLVVKDWRYVVRIPNIPIVSGGISPTVASLLELMIRAIARIPNLKMGKAAFYMNRTVFSALQIAALNKSNNALGFKDAVNQFGQMEQWTTFQGIPLRKVDAILNTESTIS